LQLLCRVPLFDMWLADRAKVKTLIQLKRWFGYRRFAVAARRRDCCAKVAWALQPFNNVHATVLQEGDLLEWLLLLNT